MEVQEMTAQDQQCWDEEIKDKKKKGLWWKILLIVVAGLMVLTAAAGLILWKVNDFYVWVTLRGESEVTMEYGQAYADPGADAYFAGTKIFTTPSPLPVETSGEVDTAVVGDYELTYSTHYEIDLLVVRFPYENVQKRVVHVVDTQAPGITLVTNEGSYTLPGTAYVEEGYTAADGYDGDLTDKVQREERDGVVYYQVADSSGNVSTAERVILYNDPTPPELTLAGNADVSIALGNSYSEPGYTAMDNCDGDITAKVVVSGAVDTAAVGTYKLEYSVTDSYNNTTTVTRTVRVYSPQPAVPMPDMPAGQPQDTVIPNGKVIYLTFDDGPSSHTSRLLDVLDQYGVRATFFVVRTGYLHLLPRMAASGHTVAMHTLTHKYDQIYTSEEAYFNDLYQMQSIIQSYTGQTPTILRFPGGSSNTVSRRYNKGIMTRLTQMLNEMNYRYFDWNVDSRDASNAKSAQTVYQNVIRGCSGKSVSIVLQHDTKGFSVDAVEMIIQWGLANGYTFLPLDPSSPMCQHALNN